MEKQRHRGFVLGSDPGPHESIVWKVRVKDEESPYDNEKFAVASVHGGIELARGLNVDFALGTLDDEEGRNVVRAVDVRLEPPRAGQEQQNSGQKARR